MTVTVENQGQGIAFMVHARITRGEGGEDVTPIFWTDNYFSLLPGESRTVTGSFVEKSLDGKIPVLIVDGYNVKATTVK